ncbi:MAG: glycosyltransferase family 1 protein, partial [Candidatus Binataceae bacterium]
MDLAAAMLLERLHTDYAETIEAVEVRPAFRRRFTRLPRMRSAKAMFNADRLINRFIDYPRTLRQCRGEFDIFHLIDHSYSHLTNYLPGARTIVTCHDLDAFRSVLEPALEPRSRAFRRMTQWLIDGLRRTAIAACDSEATRQELLRYQLLPPERTVTIWNGVSPIFSSEPEADGDREAERLLGALRLGEPEILHVGSTIPRKRIDVLLQVFAAIRTHFPDARLIRVGGPFTASQQALLHQRGLERAITVLPFIAAGTLAAIYRRAAVVILPSEAEGFGLPLAEAMACGATVIASNIPALREVGGAAALYAPVSDVDAIARMAVTVLDERISDHALDRRRRALS